jgi:NAD(P)-dependent dehydrogenase (short-subunit alcohol dehydrogenase family)
VQKGRLNEPPFFVSTFAHYRSRESGGWLSRHVAMVAGARGTRCVVYRTHNQAAGGRAVALPGDVQNESYANQLVGLATRQFGGLDIAFNNAATMGELGSIVDMSRENWTRTLETNLTSAFLGAKYQIPAMLARGGGSLIFTSTFVGHTSQSRRRSQGPPSISHRTHQASRPAPPYSPMGACRSPEPDHETQALK